MTTQPQAPDMGAIKERMRKIWTSGDYARIGNPLVIMSQRQARERKEQR